MEWPDMICVRQEFSTQAVTDIASEVASQFKELDLRNRAQRGASVAVGCSSRGIANYNSIVKATVDCLSQAGLEPFLFPAMGSHGAATASWKHMALRSLSSVHRFVHPSTPCKSVKPRITCLFLSTRSLQKPTISLSSIGSNHTQILSMNSRAAC